MADRVFNVDCYQFAGSVARSAPVKKQGVCIRFDGSVVLSGE